MVITLSNGLTIPDDELEMSAIRAQGAGGQNVNKVSTAIHLRFNIRRSSLPESYKSRLLNFADSRISSDGIVIIKAQRYRSQEKNRLEAMQRLGELIDKATAIQKHRKPTKPTRNSQSRRMDKKTLRGKTKALRGKVHD